MPEFTDGKGDASSRRKRMASPVYGLAGDSARDRFAARCNLLSPRVVQASRDGRPELDRRTHDHLARSDDARAVCGSLDSRGQRSRQGPNRARLASAARLRRPPRARLPTSTAGRSETAAATAARRGEVGARESRGREEGRRWRAGQEVRRRARAEDCRLALRFAHPHAHPGPRIRRRAAPESRAPLAPARQRYTPDIQRSHRPRRSRVRDRRRGAQDGLCRLDSRGVRRLADRHSAERRDSRPQRALHRYAADVQKPVQPASQWSAGRAAAPAGRAAPDSRVLQAGEESAPRPRRPRVPSCRTDRSISADTSGLLPGILRSARVAAGGPPPRPWRIDVCPLLSTTAPRARDRARC
jgi:hypothetical protein